MQHIPVMLMDANGVLMEASGVLTEASGVLMDARDVLMDASGVLMERFCKRRFVQGLGFVPPAPLTAERKPKKKTYGTGMP